MKRIFKLPVHVYYFISALFTLCLSYLIDSDSALDINIHDTYFIIENQLIIILLFIFYTVLGLVYFTFFKLKIQLIKWLTNIHTIITLGAFFIYEVVSNFIYNNLSDFPISDDLENLQKLLVILILIVVVTQILFIFNLTKSSIQNYKKRHKN